MPRQDDANAPRDRDDQWRKTFFAFAVSIGVHYLLGSVMTPTTLLGALAGLALLLRVDAFGALKDSLAETLRERLHLGAISPWRIFTRILFGEAFDIPSPSAVLKILDAWEGFLASREFDLLSRTASFCAIVVSFRTLIGATLGVPFTRTALEFWNGPGSGLLGKLLRQVLLAKQIRPSLFLELVLAYPLLLLSWKIGVERRFAWVLPLVAGVSTLVLGLEIARSSLRPRPDPRESASGRVVVTTSGPLPVRVQRFLEERSARLPSSLDTHCPFDPVSAGSPFVAEGDFDGDGKPDYAVETTSDTGRNTRTFVLLATGRIHRVDDGWDRLEASSTRGPTATLEGSVRLIHDTFRGVRCESSSAIYSYDPQSHRFVRYMTSD